MMVCEVPLSRQSKAFRPGNNVDIVGVHSSILCTPTILSMTYDPIAKFPLGSANLEGRY